MREKRRFAERTKLRQSDEVRKKYFLIYEGSDTEVKYFDALCSLRKDVGINPLIELIPIIRSFSEEGWSNPKKILDRVIQNLQESREKCLSYENLMNRIMDFLDETESVILNRTFSRDVWKTMQKTCEEQMGKSLDEMVKDIEDSCTVFLKALEKEYEIEHIVEDVSDIIRNGDITYEEGFDKICLIVDRDRESFVSAPGNDQYTYVLDKCREKGFHFCVTNPCFEFWLLLHFDDVLDLDMQQLLDNPKVTSKRRYAEYELRKRFPGYGKSSYQAEMLVKRIDKAIENEKKFCEDIEELEHTVGSNIGILVENMRKDN